MGRRATLPPGLRRSGAQYLGTRVVAACALVLLGTAGWIAAIDASAARAQDPEPTTIPASTTPEPAPDPAPTPTPRPKPQPKPKPAPARPRATAVAPSSVSPPATVQVQPTTQRVTRPRPAPRTTQRPPAKAKPKKAEPARVKAQRKIEPVVDTSNALPSIPAGGVAGASATSESTGSANGLLLLMMTLAVFCFAIAAVPWPIVSWRMAHYVTPRQTDVTLLGLFLMIAAGFFYVLTRGP
jgi:hypothetical protein